MRATTVTFVAATLLVLVAWLPLGHGFSSAFLWSHHLNGVKETVEYQILSPRDLANYAMTKGGWSKYLCSREEAEETADFVLLFVGKESLDVSRSTNSDQALSGIFKDALSKSNFSLAFPYVVAGSEEVGIENTLVSEFGNSCPHNSGFGRITLVGSCSVDGENFDKLQDIHAFDEYLNSRMKRASDGQTDLIMLCNGGSPSSQDIDQHSESNILSRLLGSMSQLGAKYSILYVSDPFKSTKYLPRHGLERFLAEGAGSNSSVESAVCDAVCQIKSSLLEGILVGVVLLVILISGLCCMMGIDTPTRFETPQDS